MAAGTPTWERFAEEIGEMLGTPADELTVDTTFDDFGGRAVVADLLQQHTGQYYVSLLDDMETLGDLYAWVVAIVKDRSRRPDREPPAT